MNEGSGAGVDTVDADDVILYFHGGGFVAGGFASRRDQFSFFGGSSGRGCWRVTLSCAR